MVMMNRKVCPRPGVIDTELDENEVILLHSQSNRYYSLNLTGMRIWQSLKQGLTLQETSNRLQEEFAISAHQAEHDVLAFVEELSRQNLIQIQD